MTQMNILRKIIKKIKTIPFYFPKSKKLQKILKKYGKQTLMQFKCIRINFKKILQEKVLLLFIAIIKVEGIKELQTVKWDLEKKYFESWFKKLIQKQIKNDNTQIPEEISEILEENNYKRSHKTIRKFQKKEGFISKPPIESCELSEDQKRIRKYGE